VACFSLIKFEHNIYELAKMAVYPTCQGVKVGHALLGFTIDYAKKMLGKNYFLYSNTKLESALYI